MGRCSDSRRNSALLVDQPAQLGRARYLSLGEPRDRLGYGSSKKQSPVAPCLNVSRTILKFLRDDVG